MRCSVCHQDYKQSDIIDNYFVKDTTEATSTSDEKAAQVCQNSWPSDNIHKRIRVDAGRHNLGILIFNFLRKRRQGKVLFVYDSGQLYLDKHQIHLVQNKYKYQETDHTLAFLQSSTMVF